LINFHKTKKRHFHGNTHQQQQGKSVAQIFSGHSETQRDYDVELSVRKNLQKRKIENVADECVTKKAEEITPCREVLVLNESVYWLEE
jgi:hypothetical protein